MRTATQEKIPTMGPLRTLSTPGDWVLSWWKRVDREVTVREPGVRTLPFFKERNSFYEYLASLGQDFGVEPRIIAKVLDPYIRADAEMWLRVLPEETAVPREQQTRARELRNISRYIAENGWRVDLTLESVPTFFDGVDWSHFD